MIREIPTLQQIHDNVRETLAWVAAEHPGVTPPSGEELDIAAYRICEDIADYISSEVARTGERVTIPEQPVQVTDAEGRAFSVNLGGTYTRVIDPGPDFTPAWEKRGE